MTDNSFITKFIELFTNSNPVYLLGGNKTIKDKVNHQNIIAHLEGRERIGTFPIINSTMTRFLVFDIDNNSKDTARLITSHLINDGMRPHIEKSKSKGFHIWIFLNDEQDCSLVREYMKQTLAKVGLSTNKIDLFPKQDSTSESSQYGNAINIPLFGLYRNNDDATNKFLDFNFRPIEDQESYIDSITCDCLPPIELHYQPLIQETASEQKICLSNHEAETLSKLLTVSKKTKLIRDNVIKAKKENRSDRDTIYAKHLAELMFSKELIESEISQISNKYNDKNLRGHAKAKYIEDKRNQLSYISQLLATPNEVKDRNFTPYLFKHTDEHSESYLFTKRLNVKKYKHIDERLLEWLEVEFHQLKLGDYYVISTNCGGGKSNVVKQLAVSIWAYNKERKIPNINALIALERIEDGIFLEKIAQALRPLKLSDKIEAISKFVDDELYNHINQYLNDLSNQNVLSAINTNIKFGIVDGRLKRIESKAVTLTDIKFKCAPSAKICSQGFTDNDFSKNVCASCKFTQCPANPERGSNIQNSSVAISTHQSLMRSSEWGQLRTGPNKNPRQLLLVDEKPEALNLFTFFLEKSGNNYVSSLDKLIFHLKENNLVELYDELNNNLLRKLKEVFSKAKSTHRNLNSGNQNYDIYKSYSIPSISIKNRSRLQSLKQDIWKNILDLPTKRDLSDLIEMLLLINGKEDAIITFGKRSDKYELRLEVMVNQWMKLIPNEESATIIFDATANIDPSYLVDGAPKIKHLNSLEEVSFPNLHLIFYSDKDISKDSVTAGHCNSLFTYLSAQHPSSEKLIVHSKEKFKIVTDSISKTKGSDLFNSDHFNNLKGKNNYLNCNVIAFTNLLRRTESNYVLIAQEIYKTKKGNLSQKYVPNISPSWSLKRGVGELTNLSESTFVFNDKFLDNVRTSVDLVDIIQTIFRISLRTNYSCENYVYLPIASSGLIKKIIHYFRGANVSRISI